MNVDYQYKDLIERILAEGDWAENRTGIRTKFILGHNMKFNVAEEFPLLTLKRVNWKSCFAEMLGFWRGCSSAGQFRALGTNVWNANANANEEWVANPNRLGEDDLGRIYGVQARNWGYNFHARLRAPDSIDQLLMVYNDLRRGEDNRREIVTHWNPAELHMMALPPCHLLYQFGLRGKREETGRRTLDLQVYIRSNDVGLGMPFNIAGYAWLLTVMARITGHRVGTLHYLAFNAHIYENHIEPLQKMVLPLPPKEGVQIRLDLQLSYANGWYYMADSRNGVEDVLNVYNYDPWPAVKLPMAV